VVVVENPLKIKLDFKALNVPVLRVLLPIFFKLYFSNNFLESILLLTIVEEKELVEASSIIAKQAVYNMVFIVDMICSKINYLIKLKNIYF
jgi:hypothetical protein